MPPKAKVKGKKAVVRKMPAPIPNGEIVTDGVKKQQWVIGASIGKGGFGVIYLAALKGKDTTSTEHVIKIVSDLGWVANLPVTVSVIAGTHRQRSTVQ